jgi:hypothetical protein
MPCSVTASRSIEALRSAVEAIRRSFGSCSIIQTGPSPVWMRQRNSLSKKPACQFRQSQDSQHGTTTNMSATASIRRRPPDAQGHQMGGRGGCRMR